MGIIRNLRNIKLRMTIRWKTRKGFNEIIKDAINKGSTVQLPGATAMLTKSAIHSYYTSLITSPLSLLLRFEGVDFDGIVEEEYTRAQNRYAKMFGEAW